MNKEPPRSLPEDASGAKVAHGNGKKDFPGTTRILCDGLMVTSGANSWLWLTLVLILGPFATFMAVSYDHAGTTASHALM